MQISARSYLTAGMAAVVGAGAIVMAPALPNPALRTLELPTAVVAEIALAGTSLPLEQIWTLLQSVGTGGSLEGIFNVVFSAVGTEFATQALPLVTVALTDVATFLGAALNDVFSSGAFQVDFPGILTGVGTALGAGDFPGALQTLTGGLSAPVTHVVQSLFGSDFQAFLTNKVGTVLGALPEILRSAVQKVLGLDIKPVTDAIAVALSGLVPNVAPGASTPGGPVVLATAVEVPTMPAIRLTAPVTSAPAAVSALPGSAASVPAADESTAAPALDGPAPQQSAVDVTARAELDAALTPPRVAHRGPAESAGDAGPASAKPVGRHRGASDASPAAAERAGR